MLGSSSSVTGSEVTLTPSTSQIAKVALVSWFGTLVHNYDFTICGTLAAVAWPAVFFPTANVASGILLSLSVWVIGYCTRPLGGCLFSHFGDRYGRRVPLVMSLTLMGLASLAIGLVPPYNATGIFPGIGIWGGILATVFRFCQGLGEGGEFGSAATWVAEYANRSKRRSVWTALTQQSVAISVLASTSTLTLILAVFSRAAFLDWGWRLPFYFGSTVCVIGVLIRFRMTEAPIFRNFLEKRKVARMPSLSVFKEMPGTVLKLSGALIWFVGTGNYMATSFGVAYMQQASKVPPAFATSTAVLAAPGMSSAAFIGSFLANTRLGRRGTFLFSQIGLIIIAFPYFLMLGSGNAILLYLAEFLLPFVAYIGTGAIFAFETEAFPTKFRVSGASWTHNLGTTVSSFIPLISAAIIATGGMAAWPYVSITMMAYGGIAAMCTLSLPEPSKGELRED